MKAAAAQGRGRYRVCRPGAYPPGHSAAMLWPGRARWPVPLVPHTLVLVRVLERQPGKACCTQDVEFRVACWGSGLKTGAGTGSCCWSDSPGRPGASKSLGPEPGAGVCEWRRFWGHQPQMLVPGLLLHAASACMLRLMPPPAHNIHQLRHQTQDHAALACSAAQRCHSSCGQQPACSCVALTLSSPMGCA